MQQDTIVTHIFSLLGAGLLRVALPALGTLLSALAVNYVQKKAKQAGVELTQAQTDLLKTQVTNAIQAVQERAMRSEKAGVIVSGEEKRAAVLSIMESRPAIDHLDLHQAIDAALPEVRAKLAAPITMGHAPPQGERS